MPTMEEYAKQPREQRLKRLERTPEEVTAVIRGQSDAVLSWRPDPRNWAAKEVVCHLRDTEELFMLRFETIMAAEEPSVTVIDPDRWAQDRQYLRNDAGEAAAAFRKRRDESLAFLRKLDVDQWKRGAIHPVRGRFTIDDLASLMAAHDDNHVDQLKRAVEGRA